MSIEEKALAEPYKVLLKRGEFVDETRRNDDGSVRVVPYKIYYPVEHGLERMPVIFWSHGFGGNRDGASFLSRALAGRGYILVHLTHPGTDSSLWEGQEGHPWDILQKTKVSRTTTINRLLDVPFVLDQLPAWAEENPEAGDAMDFAALGMSGHSFGAMTTQAMAGMKFPHADGTLHSYREPRFKAGILYSPVPIAHLTDAPPEEVYAAIDMPLLHMSGTEDDSPLEEFGYKDRIIVHKYSQHPQQYLHVLEGGDHMIYAGSRGKLGHNPLREQHEAEIVRVAGDFWDAYLKGDEAALGRLEAATSF
ncbi:MAG: hypothetical protein KDI46_00390 [Alphaproteobacteria bacterium]|nr:hypothetical protein [Alphaproteobacteria bacterium]